MFQLSPGVNVTEIDATAGIPTVSTSEAAIAGVFRWGPVGQRVLVSSEPDLVKRFQKPSNFNAETWFVAANFLAYADKLHVVRVNTGYSAMAVFAGSTAPNAATQTINNQAHYDSNTVAFSANVGYVAKYPGELGNSLRISVCDSAAAFNTNIPLVANADIATTSNIAFAVGSSTATVSVGFTGSGTQATANAQAYSVNGKLAVGDKILVGNNTIGTQYVKIKTVGAVTGNSTISSFTLTLAEPYRLHTAWSSNTVNRYWEFSDIVESAPGTSSYVSSFGNTAATDEIHLVVVDELGGFTGAPGTILEVHKDMSRATDAKTEDGATNYYKNVINTKSNYLWFATDRTGAASANALSISSPTTTAPFSVTLSGGTNGADESSVTLAALAAGYDLFIDPEQADISFILNGKSLTGGAKMNYIIDNIAEVRQDCVVFGSPPKSAVVDNTGNEVDSIVSYAGALRSSSYAFLDSGYKYQYDKYNDVMRYVPLNGDMAGLCARTDQTNDAWWSPGGYNRGRVKNIVKLAFNPSVRAQRDILYKNNINPVVTEKGEGTILLGDKTLLRKNSAFSRINVRRLFIVLEKAIARDAKYMLFEFNDEFTRAQFRNRVNPFLRDVQGRRGLTFFEVICDSTNNTDEVVERGEFVGDIFVRPNRSINFIQLNFTAVRGTVSFNEIIGNY